MHNREPSFHLRFWTVLNARPCIMFSESLTTIKATRPGLSPRIRPLACWSRTRPPAALALPAA